MLASQCPLWPFRSNSSDPSRCRLAHEIWKILRCRPTSAAHELWEILPVSWPINDVSYRRSLCGYVLLLLQHLCHHTLPTWYLDLQPFEEALVGPVHVTPAPVALLQPLVLGTAPPLVVGAVALPA